MRAHILGTGRYLPERVVTNDEIAQRAPTSDEWIRERLGIRERRFAADHEQTSDLAAAAARRALAAAGVTIDDIDMIIVALGHGDVISPATACYVQEKLEAWRAVAFDIRAACAGFIVALDLARCAVESGSRRHVLVIGASIVSRTELDWSDRTSSALFGDGAGAAVVGAAREPDQGFLASTLGSDGRDKEAVGVFGGGSIAPLTAESIARGEHTIRMDGKRVLRGALRHMPGAVRTVLSQAGLTLDDVALLVTHQGNARLVDAVARALDLGPERVHTTVETLGNTLSASAAITLDDAIERGRLKRGDLLALSAVGAGLTYGAHLIRW